MFTGIITHTGVVSAIDRSKIAIQAGRAILHAVELGASMSVDGVCLTVVSKNKDIFTAHMMPETMKRTILSTLHMGMKVNLELPATPSSFLSGHLVEGHVDGVGTVEKISVRGHDRVLSIALLPSLSRYVVKKGAVAVNGISLTVIESRRAQFTVGIIPHTWKNTMLYTLSIGDRVNIEVDVLAKYIEKFVRKRRI